MQIFENKSNGAGFQTTMALEFGLLFTKIARIGNFYVLLVPRATNGADK